MSSSTDHDPGAGQVPEEGGRVDFHTFIMSLCTSGMLHLGEIPDPETGKARVNLAMARDTIDILRMIEEKTRGNLSRTEADLLQRLLYDLRIKYVAKKGK